MESVGKLIDKVKSMGPDDKMDHSSGSSSRDDEGGGRRGWDRGERYRGRY